MNLSPRHEKFAQLVASGEPAGRAYEKCGYDSRGASADAQAARLIRTAKVAARIAEIRKQCDELCTMSKEEAIDFLVECIRKPIGEIDTAHRLAQEYQEPGEHSGGRIKMPAKLDALDKLAKLCGWYAPEKKEITGDAFAAMLAELRARK